MQMRHAIVGIGLLLLAGTAVAADKPFDDAAFIKKAVSGGMLEVRLGELAEKMGQSDGVKKFGAKMVTDHTTANLKLLEIAKAAKVTVPDKLMDEHQKTADHFKAMKAGAEFDKHYVDDMVKDHEEDIAEFEKASKEATNPDLKAFAAKTLPTLKEHHEMVKKLQHK
ncbi:DUF4142 domain-containing protein [Limnoglobus roseus]|uniref:DUF4142 domain-containing protein n=1 Tax=Limnoglobus roseus TaxID=2598579 RepID=A0A5C1AJW5_9BACT|nr:DUF4142 domain-containing protein [Limnoglobus roseus]QEL19160.1 hypothetical protein PX52LOC_06218 [Limnoglobus roseus]